MKMLNNQDMNEVTDEMMITDPAFSMLASQAAIELDMRIKGKNSDTKATEKLLAILKATSNNLVSPSTQFQFSGYGPPRA